MSFAECTAKALGPTPYTPAYKAEVNWRRQHSGGELAIDRLLRYAGVPHPTIVYPPESRDDFLTLVGSIEHSDSNTVHKSRAILFLFLDFSNPIETKSKPQTTVAEYYASQLLMSEPEQALVQALWFLDHSQAEKSLELLGHPWELHGAESLHEYIVTSLAGQRPSAVACYLAARGGTSDTFVDQLSRSLILRGKFAEVLDIERVHQTTQYLVEMAKAAVENKEKSTELVQLPFTPEEWSVIQDELYRIITTASPTFGEVNATSTLARNIILVRALHTGDLDTLKELKGTSDTTDLLISRYIS